MIWITEELMDIRTEGSTRGIIRTKFGRWTLVFSVRMERMRSITPFGTTVLITPTNGAINGIAKTSPSGARMTSPLHQTQGRGRKILRREYDHTSRRRNCRKSSPRRAARARARARALLTSAEQAILPLQPPTPALHYSQEAPTHPPSTCSTLHPPFPSTPSPSTHHPAQLHT